MAAEVYVCSSCGAHSNKFWKRLSKGNVGALIKLRRAIGQYNRNDIHIAQEVDLTYSERANFSTLRQHGMVAHIKDEKGNRVSGRWLLTKRGAAFLKGQLEVPLKVQTMNNKVIGHSEEYVTIEQVMKTLPVFDDRWDIPVERVPLDMAQQSIFDDPAMVQ